MITVNDTEFEIPDGADTVSYRWFVRMVGKDPYKHPKLTYLLPDGAAGEGHFGDTIPAVEGAVYTVTD